MMAQHQQLDSKLVSTDEHDHFKIRAHHTTSESAFISFNLLDAGLAGHHGRLI